MNAKAFLVDALSSALDLGFATPDDIVRHVTPDVLAAHLPRPLWARLLTACVGAPRVDGQLIVETVGVANLVEHLPLPILWTVLAEVGTRALGGTFVAPPRTDYAAASAPVAMGTPSPPVAPVKPLSIDSPPPPEPPKPTRQAPVNPGPSIPNPSQPLAEIAADIDAELAAAAPTPSRTRSATNRFRPTSTNIGRLASTRRPQASVPSAAEPTTETPLEAAPPSPPEPPPQPRRQPRRGETESELEVETAVASAEDWAKKLDVEDENLVEWSGETTRPSDDVRKR